MMPNPSVKRGAQQRGAPPAQGASHFTLDSRHATLSFAPYLKR
jgi:hypothetical protein